MPRHDQILTQKIRFGQLLFVNWRNKEANRSWQIHDPPWGNAPHVLKKIKKHLVMNSPSPKIKKNSKGIAAATEEKFCQPLLKTFSTRCCSSCRVFDSLSSQTFPLVLPALARSHALFAACSFQSRVDFLHSMKIKSQHSRKTCT